MATSLLSAMTMVTVSCVLLSSVSGQEYDYEYDSEDYDDEKSSTANVGEIAIGCFCGLLLVSVVSALLCCYKDKIRDRCRECDKPECPSCARLLSKVLRHRIARGHDADVENSQTHRPTSNSITSEAGHVNPTLSRSDEDYDYDYERSDISEHSVITETSETTPSSTTSPHEHVTSSSESAVTSLPHLCDNMTLTGGHTSEADDATLASMERLQRQVDVLYSALDLVPADDVSNQIHPSLGRSSGDDEYDDISVPSVMTETSAETSVETSLNTSTSTSSLETLPSYSESGVTSLPPLDDSRATSSGQTTRPDDFRTTRRSMERLQEDVDMLYSALDLIPPDHGEDGREEEEEEIHYLSSILSDDSSVDVDGPPTYEEVFTISGDLPSYDEAIKKSKKETVV